MSKPDIWMPWYIGDYQRDTQHLSTLEHGAYRLLIDAYWCNRGPLPDRDEDFARITRLSLSDWLATRSRIAPFFQPEDDPASPGAVRWRHGRIDRELEKAIKQHDAKRLGAHLTNTRRWPIKSHSDSLSDTDSGSLKGRPSPSPSPPSSPAPSESVPPIPQGGNGEDEAFERFWAAYPRRVGKGSAKKAFEKKHCLSILPRILKAVGEQSGTVQWQKDGGQFIPHPATWINQERWQDDVSSFPAAIENQHRSAV